MRNRLDFRMPKWPFFLGDAFLLGMACFIYWGSKYPLARWEMTACGVCVALGAALGVLPYLLEYRALLKLAEISTLESVTEKIQKLESVAAQINGATNHWHSAQEQADKTAALAREVADRMAAEIRDFSEFMEKINQGEKANLRLEVEKLRRAEGDWLNVLVHTLDHVYALYHAAERSGQVNLIGQLGQFQNACRDAARRVGLLPLLANHADPFDDKRHKWADGETPPAGALVAEMLATGYTFQGKFIRPALVRTQGNGAAQTTTEKISAPETEQNQLPLESAGSAT
jgi:molecular chaperone GrpE (heat shock protein)